MKDGLHPVLYLPEKDEVYRLPPEMVETEFLEHITSCRGKLFFVPRDISKSQYYDPDLKRWFPAPCTLHSDSILQLLTSPGRYYLRTVLVVKNEVCFIVDYRESLTWLSRYDFDADLMVPPIQWLNKKSVCFVGVDKCIYAIGGVVELVAIEGEVDFAYRECSKFDTQEDKWQDIASLQIARWQAFGVGVNEKIIIAGGLGDFHGQYLKTCEVYEIETDEWNSIASLTVPRPFGNMVLVNQTLLVMPCYRFNKEFPMECYDQEKEEKDEWNVKKTSRFQNGWSYSSSCSVRLFKGTFCNLKRIHFDK